MLYLFAFVLFAFPVFGEKSYAGYKIIDIFPSGVEQVQLLAKLQIDDIELDFWQEPAHIGSKGTILVPPHRFVGVTAFLAKQGIKVEVRDTDVQKNIEEERKLINEGRRLRPDQFAYDYNNYNRFADFVSEIDRIVANCPTGLSCTTRNIGTSIEGRPLKTLVLSTGSGRQAVWIDSLIHAREWLAGATLMNIINHMVTGFGSDAEVNNLLNNHDFHFLPVVNPDGYEFSHTNDRYWRKNRRNGATCQGVDINRNFDYLWGEEGVSHAACSEVYCGASGASEPETQAVQNEVLRIGASRFTGLITIHSYAYVWLFPWSNTENHNGRDCVLASDHADLMRVANAAATATQQTHGTHIWERGNGCEVLGPLTGATDEWAKSVGVKYSYTIELRGNDFVIAPSQIQPSFEEIWNGVVAFCNTIGL